MTSPPTLLPSPTAQPHGVVPRRFICYLRHPFSTSIILSIRPLHRSPCNTIHFTSVSCGLYSASCVLWTLFCVPYPVSRVSRVLWTVFLYPALHLVPHDRIYMPSNHCTAPSLYCPIVSPMYCAAPFQLLQSPISCRQVISNPAPMFRALLCASHVLLCVRLCALFPVLVSTCSLSLAPRPCPSASLVPPLAPYHTSPSQRFILPYGNSKRCALSFSPLQPRI